MRVLIDGDSCQKRLLIEHLAQERKIPVIIYCTNDHQLQSDYATIKYNDGGSNRTDNFIYQDCQKSDIVITNDIGLASLCLLKNHSVITNYGKLYTKDNIEAELLQRNIFKAQLKKNKRNHIKQSKEHFDFIKVFISAVIHSENLERSTI